MRKYIKKEVPINSTEIFVTPTIKKCFPIFRMRECFKCHFYFKFEFGWKIGKSYKAFFCSKCFQTKEQLLIWYKKTMPTGLGVDFILTQVYNKEEV